MPARIRTLSPLTRHRQGHYTGTATNDSDLSLCSSTRITARSKHTITWLEIPDWQRDNDFILTGYRRQQNSWKGCVHSVFAYLHNETVNIHSHLVGALLFLLFLGTYHERISRYSTTTWLDSAVFAIFLGGAVLCLGASAIYHAGGCHSERVARSCNALDYFGIVVLTVGSFYPAIYYGFYCQPFFQILWLSAITLLGAGAAYIVLDPEYSKPTHRSARTTVFVALGTSAIAPVGQLIVSQGLLRLYEQGFGYLFLSGVLYISGALLYANRIPERFAPGQFDIFFASHQIFHFCVVGAAYAHYVSILTALDHWHSAAACTGTSI